MEDKRIVELYWKRSESAITETNKKYGKYCRYIAKNILNSDTDAEDCVNDTYLKAWYAIPPERPSRLSAFLGKITRNLALNRAEYNSAAKRFGTALILDEMEEIVPDTCGELSDEIVLRDAINGFLATLPSRTRIIFLRRYWYMSSIRDIAHDLHVSESSVKVVLHRTRIKFKQHLEREGVTV